MDVSFLNMSKYARKVYEKLESSVCRNYDLTLIEMDILLFLANNPEYVTAQDIVEVRMLAKSHVSTSVDHLIKTGFLSKSSAQKRNIPLALTSRGLEAAKAGQMMQVTFSEILKGGFEEEEMEQLQKFHERITKNLLQAYEQWR